MGKADNDETIMSVTREEKDFLDALLTAVSMELENDASYDGETVEHVKALTQSLTLKLWD